MSMIVEGVVRDGKIELPNGPALVDGQHVQVVIELPALQAEAPTSDPSRKPVWERILERTAEIPDEEWHKLPTDLAAQHDHYLYGTPKRSDS